MINELFIIYIVYENDYILYILRTFLKNGIILRI